MACLAWRQTCSWDEEPRRWRRGRRGWVFIAAQATTQRFRSSGEGLGSVSSHFDHFDDMIVGGRPTVHRNHRLVENGEKQLRYNNELDKGSVSKDGKESMEHHSDPCTDAGTSTPANCQRIAPPLGLFPQSIHQLMATSGQIGNTSAAITRSGCAVNFLCERSGVCAPPVSSSTLWF